MSTQRVHRSVQFRTLCTVSDVSDRITPVIVRMLTVALHGALSYSCCFAPSSARKRISRARVGESVSDSNSFLMWSRFACDDALLHSEFPLFDKAAQRDERRSHRATVGFALRWSDLRGRAGKVGCQYPRDSQLQSVSSARGTAVLRASQALCTIMYS